MGAYAKDYPLKKYNPRNPIANHSGNSSVVKFYTKPPPEFSQQVHTFSDVLTLETYYFTKNS
jgi:hypothetical protein